MDDDLRSMIAEYRQLSTANVSDGLAHLLQLATFEALKPADFRGFVLAEKSSGAKFWASVRLFHCV